MKPLLKPKLPQPAYHEKSCATCRYFRMSSSDFYSACCILLSKHLATAEYRESLDHRTRSLVCSAWKPRPKRWKIEFTKDPMFSSAPDPYVSMNTIFRLRRNYR
jgi:hypothetical protein